MKNGSSVNWTAIGAGLATIALLLNFLMQVQQYGRLQQKVDDISTRVVRIEQGIDAVRGNP